MDWNIWFFFYSISVSAPKIQYWSGSNVRWHNQTFREVFDSYCHTVMSHSQNIRTTQCKNQHHRHVRRQSVTPASGAGGRNQTRPQTTAFRSVKLYHDAGIQMKCTDTHIKQWLSPIKVQQDREHTHISRAEKLIWAWSFMWSPSTL